MSIQIIPNYYILDNSHFTKVQLRDRDRERKRVKERVRERMLEWRETSRNSSCQIFNANFRNETHGKTNKQTTYCICNTYNVLY